MLFKPNMLKQTFFYSICPIDDRLKCLDCNECASLYTFSNVDKIVAVIIMSVHFWRDATYIQRDQVSRR